MQAPHALSRIRNVILVSFDCARADVTYGLGLPSVERLRQRGVTFRNCVSSAPLTPISHATIMTGLQPFHHGIRHLFKEQMKGGCATIAEVLAKQGFFTAATVSCPGLNRWYGINHGFEIYDDEVPPLPGGQDALHTVDVELRGQALKRASSVIDRASDHLAKNKADRFFYFIHFFDAHWPYGPPEAHKGGCHIANPYEAELAYVDHYFNQWLDWLEHSGRLDDTLIVLFGDHGEDLNGWYPNDKAGEDRNHPEEKGHGCLLYDATIMVPLIFYHPSLKQREVVEQVALVDIFPTCLELLGLSPPGRVDGVSLAGSIVAGAPVPGVSAYSETFYPREMVEATKGKFDWVRNKKSVRIGNKYKAIYHLDSEIVEAYDLVSDPLEQHDLMAKNGF
jgi:arylsulfatase